MLSNLWDLVFRRMTSGTRHAMVVLIGFQIILIALILATSTGLTSLREVNEHTAGLSLELQKKTTLLNRMHELLRERMWHVHTLLELEDPFLIEDEWEVFIFTDSEFLAVQQQLEDLNLSPRQQRLLEKHKPLIDEARRIMDIVAGLARERKIEESRALLQQMREATEKVLSDLAEMRNYLESSMHEQLVSDARLAFFDTQKQVLIINGFGVLFSICIIAFVLYRVMYREEALSKALNELQEANESLESRVAARTADLVQARDHALEANKTKSRFLANMSHELRTPLNAIIGYSDMLIEEHEELNGEEIEEDLNKVNRAGRHLLELINDVLDISKIEAGKMEIHPENFNIRMLIQEVFDIMQPLAVKKHNALELSYSISDEMMYADPIRVRQILVNLLSNAVKFTDFGLIQLDVASLEREGRPFLLFRLKDSGIGISEENLRKLFQPFTQVDSSSTRKHGGTGLGLVISLRFCQMMGGYIEVSSQLGEGTCFSVYIPKHVQVTPNA